MYNEIQTNKSESDECLSKGICSVNPRLSALHEVILVHLKELSFYLLKLKELGGTNEKIKETVTEALSGILANAEYSQQQFHKIVSELDNYINQAKILYKNFCDKNGLEALSLKLYFKHGKDSNLTEAIKKGEKYSIKKSTNFSPQQKNLYDIMLFLIKSMCIKNIELKRLGEEKDEYYYTILSMLNAMNITDFSEEKTKEELKNAIQTYYKLIVDVFQAQVSQYGEMEPVEVSFSTIPGKAILVSGSDYKKLEEILIAAEHKDISVYTHGDEMLLAHAFPKLRAYPNLKGHFGLGADTSVIDFAEFPGPILMTKLTLHSAVSLFRGRLFTLDPIAPPSVVMIKDNNYEPIINAALESKGFINGREKPPVKVGFSEKEVYQKLDTIIDKIINKEIKHLYIVGLFNFHNICDKYFETFFDILPKDCYTISLSCNKNRENIFHVDSIYDYTLLYKILNHLNQKIPLTEVNMSVFVTKCNKHTIASLLYLKDIGVKNVYVCKCPPMLINPALMETLQNTFEIKEFTDPRRDLNNTLKE